MIYFHVLKIDFLQQFFHEMSLRRQLKRLLENRSYAVLFGRCIVFNSDGIRLANKRFIYVNPDCSQLPYLKSEIYRRFRVHPTHSKTITTRASTFMLKDFNFTRIFGELKETRTLAFDAFYIILGDQHDQSVSLVSRRVCCLVITEQGNACVLHAISGILKTRSLITLVSIAWKNH